MYKASINLMKTKGINFQKGLTKLEIQKIENIYNIVLPDALKFFLMHKIPVSEGFYNWRDFSEENISFIAETIMYPFHFIGKHAAEVYWCDEWGDAPQNITTITQEVKRRLLNAPKVIPIFKHRYMPMIKDENPPILSIHGVDIIYYGQNLEDYFMVEFGKKNHELIQFNEIKAVPFWSDIM